MEVDATHLEWTARVGRHHHGPHRLPSFGRGGASDDTSVMVYASRIMVLRCRLVSRINIVLLI